MQCLLLYSAYLFVGIVLCMGREGLKLCELVGGVC